MGTITATVYGDEKDKKPKVDKDPIVVPQGDGETTITWSAGDGIAGFTIEDLSRTVFTYAVHAPPSTTFSALDRNDRPGRYPYKVKATHTSGVTAEHDPKIENGGG